MQTLHVSSSAVALSVFLLGFGIAPRESGAQGPPHEQNFHLGGFPDFGYMVTPTEYKDTYSKTEPIFRLKTDFPDGVAPQELPRFMTEIDFRKEPEKYLMAAQRYSFEGNLPAFGGGEVAWDPFANKVRPWYHIPWLHPTTAYPPNGGTEGFRGLIKEAEVNPYQLAGTQSGSYQVYAITLVNEYAGYTLARMWKDPNNPDPRATDRRYDGGFPPGTVFAKLLFTDAPAQAGKDQSNPFDVVPYLNNGVDWNVYITADWDAPNREVKTVHLLQMDLMMRDPRSEEFMGWVFGTFVYNGAVKNPKSNFLNLVPLGLMWGNDPTNTRNNVNPYPPKPIGDIINENLKQQKVFVLQHTPPQHLGWNSRLNGPADLNTSSCMSCHISAEYPPLSSLVAPSMVPPGGPLPPAEGGTRQWMEWFQNIEWATPRDPEAFSTDMSWQISIAFQNFYTNKSKLAEGQWVSEFLHHRRVIGRDGGTTRQRE